MANELAYAMITPYSLHKSRTGGIIGRLLSLSNLEFVGVRMYAPSDAFVDQYLKVMEESTLSELTREAMLTYIDENLRKNNPLGLSNRVMVLLFEGDDAVRHLNMDVIGTVMERPRPSLWSAQTIRGTFGDFQVTSDGTIRYFEPAVITAPDMEANRQHLQLLCEHATSDGGVIEHVIQFPPDAEPETSLVILKPDNFYRRSRRPGNIIDVFSKTGLYIVGAELFSMTVAQGEEFYAPLKELFRTRLVDNIEDVLREHLDGAFDFDLPNEFFESAKSALAGLNADSEFNRIVQYMTGMNPRLIRRPEQKQHAGATKCFALLYRGVNAVNLIRKWLGSTDPDRAAVATVRSDFGRDLMRNAAHASDSPDNAERERKIIGLWKNGPQPPFQRTIERYLSSS
ncbi:MAG: nucleoside-diphosphate kinase [Planctomycetia bacterium]|nr:nucleoside-diphosphate kinase [Planctomycetia bacterium]